MIVYRSKVCFLFSCLVAILVSCVAAPDFPDVPNIEYIGVTKRTMVQDFFPTDSILVKFGFTDGDGDLGFFEGEEASNIFITDSRTGERYGSDFALAAIPIQGASKGIEGDITLKLYTVCCFFPDNIPNCEAPPQYPRDTLTIDIQMMDRAGNMSNIITTESIILLCQ